MKNVEFANFISHGSDKDGYLSVVEKGQLLNFDIKRVYTITKTQENSIRGYHAHRKLWQMFFALNGKIEVFCEDIFGNTETYILDSPEQGLLCGPMVWHTLTYHNNAVLMVLASEKYDESDYIRDYNEFKRYENTSK